MLAAASSSTTSTISGHRSPNFARSPDVAPQCPLHCDKATLAVIHELWLRLSSRCALSLFESHIRCKYRQIPPVHHACSIPRPGMLSDSRAVTHLWWVARRPRTPSAGRMRSRRAASSARGSSSICSSTMSVSMPSCRARSACARIAAHSSGASSMTEHWTTRSAMSK